MDEKSLGQKILELRKKAGFSQEELGNLVNASRQSVSKWELDEVTPCSEKIKELCTLFSVSADYLLGNKIDDHAETHAEIAVKPENDNTKKPKTHERKKMKTSTKVIIAILVVLEIVFLIISMVFGPIVFDKPSEGSFQTVYSIGFGDSWAHTAIALTVIIPIALVIMLVYRKIKNKKE